MKRAYLDIETTGLSRYYCDITVIGVGVEVGRRVVTVQLMENGLTERRLLRALKGVERIYTYNGSRFDLPFIRSQLGIDLTEEFTHHDLMYDCWRNNLYGGLKAVERQLGINRELQGVDGYEAVRLWWRYVDSFDLDALNTLLEYNKEDVINLKVLKEMLL